MVFWEHPDMLEAVNGSVHKANLAIPVGGGAHVEVGARMARIGVIVHPFFDELYDEYLGITSVSSM
jgi:hypothetical protein